MAHINKSTPSQSPKGAFLLLLVVGSLLAISVLLSKVAAGRDAPMLTYLALAMGGSGFVLAVMNGGMRTADASVVTFVSYSVVAGALMSLGSALGYLTVHKVGAAFIALALAFPPMLTWLFSLFLRIESFDLVRLVGLLIGLAGGVVLAIGKGLGPSADVEALLIACAMPVVLAVGNVFRTQFWPSGASPRDLASAMLMFGAMLTMPVALYFEGISATAVVLKQPMLIVFFIAVVTFVAQYVAFFQLQQIAGPVYMSQIGSVAAIVGSPVAVIVLGEDLPRGFLVAATMILIGIAVFQYRAARPKHGN